MIMMSMSTVVRPLIMTFNTSLASTVTFNVTGAATITWGDGATINLPSGGTAVKLYSPGSIQTITITGSSFYIDWTGGSGAQGLTNITQWGDSLMNQSHRFTNCTNLTVITASDTPQFAVTTTPNPTSTDGMFAGCSFLTSVTNIGSWNVSQVVWFTNMFSGCTRFNQSLSTWDMSGATLLGGMFQSSGYNQSLNSWNVANVINTNFMFAYCTVYNQPMNSWNTSSLRSSSAMFWNATSFNQNIGTWNVSLISNFSEMFRNATAFNNGQAAGVLGTGMNRTASSGWRTNSATNMILMFSNAVSFNQNLDKWCVSFTGTKPGGFDDVTTSWTGGTTTRPQWGTCPIP